MVNPIVFAIPVFLAAMLLELWLARRRGRDVYRTADAMTSLHMGVLSQIVAVFAVGLNIGIYAAIEANFSLFKLDATSPWVWAAGLLFYDFLYYWKHRAGHEVHVMWAAHVVHHSSEDYNLSTALRQSASDALLNWLFYVPMALLGFPVLVYVVVGLIDLLYQFWPHTQLIGKLGWFDRVFVSPSNHRVHHGQNDYCLDRNYGGILIIWDRMFGTFAEERDDEPVVYGVRNPLHSWDPLWGNLQVYAQIGRGVRDTPGLGPKLKRILAGPGWQPAGSTEHPAFEAQRFARYETPASPALRRYAMLAFGISTALLTHFLIAAPVLATTAALVYGLVMLLGMLALGDLLGGHRGAALRELLRLLLVLGMLVFGYWFTPVALWAQALAGIALLASVLLLWKSATTASAAQDKSHA